MLPAHLRPWLLASGLVVVGVLYLFVLIQPFTALVFVLAAALVPLVAPRLRKTPSITDASSPLEGAGLESLARLIEGLGIEGRGIHVPVGAEVRLFLPAEDDIGEADIPRLDDETTLLRTRPGALGVALTPPGAPLYRAWRDAHAPLRTGSPEAAAAAIKTALPELGLGADIRVEASARSLRIQYRHTAHATTCRSTREEWAPWHLQGGCVVCSFIAVLAAATTETPLRIQNSEVAGDTVSLILEAIPKKGRLVKTLEREVRR